MRRFLILIGFVVFLVSGHWFLVPAQAQTSSNTYYIAPSGNDSNSGLSQSQPLHTFETAWEKVFPGDTLYLLDGTYTPANSTKDGIIRPNYRDGQAGAPITIKAFNDGKAIIDGQYQKIPVQLGEVWGDPGTVLGNWFIIEGIVAKNSSHNVYTLWGDHTILRRTSGFNANTDGNDSIYGILGNDILVEDCVAAGTGRKMIANFSSDGSQTGMVVRRCLADWHDWRGLNWCSNHWPWGDEVQIYHGHDNIIENTLAIGSHSGIGINIQNQSGGSFTVNNNQVLGSIVTNGGMDPTNQPSGLRFWGTNPPQVDPHTWDVPNPNCGPWCSCWGGIQRSGFSLYGSHMFNTVFRDVLATNNAGSGLSLSTATNFSGTVERVTLVNNGLDTSFGNVDGNLNLFMVTNSYIPGTVHNNPTNGARLTQRYVDGVLTTQELWPWPMEDRVKTEYAREFGLTDFSVTCTIGHLVNQYTNYPITNINVDDYCGAVTPPSPTGNPPPVIGDLDGDAEVDLLDLLKLITGFNTPGPGNFNLTGLVDIFDFSRILQNL